MHNFTKQSFRSSGIPALHKDSGLRGLSSLSSLSSTGVDIQKGHANSARYYASSPKGPLKKLRLDHSTKKKRFSHYIKADREKELREFWEGAREVQNQAFVHRYINFSRIYARFRDLPYLQYTMKDWDTAIDRLFVHSRGKQPANELVRKHPYLLIAKILPLQFAKNAVKGRLPMYDWRMVLRDLTKLAGKSENPSGQQNLDSISPPQKDEAYQEHTISDEEREDWMNKEEEKKVPSAC